MLKPATEGDKSFRPLLQRIEVEKPPEIHLLQRKSKCPQSRDLLQEFPALSYLPLKISSFCLLVLPSSPLFSGVSQSDKTHAN